MKKFQMLLVIGALAIGVILFGVLLSNYLSDSFEETVPTSTTSTSTTIAVVTTTTTTVPTTITTVTTTTIAEVKSDTVPEVFVDFPDPVEMFSEALESEAVVTTESTRTDKNDPVGGEVQWIPVGENQPGPCEMGLVLMASHVNKGEPHYNLVDDSENDKHGKTDHGLQIGDKVTYQLTDGRLCEYVVIEPFGTMITGVEQIEEQPAIYFNKEEAVMNPILYQLIQETGDRKIVSMWVSYAGPNGNEFVDRHRVYNAVVFGELVEEESETR